MSPVAVPQGPKSADEMDQERSQTTAYEYLCRLEEAKNWMSACLQEELPAPTELESSLTNGVYMAKLGHYMAPELVPLRKIFDPELKKFYASGLHFRHTDNINYFLKAVRHIGLPEIFLPETTDVYDRKNMPRVIFCIHALSLFLYKLGVAPQMQDLFGKVQFSEEDISAMQTALDDYGLPMPQFRKINGILADEMPSDEAAVHAAIIAINDALDQEHHEATLNALRNPSACLSDVHPAAVKKYHVVLSSQKYQKAEMARSTRPEGELDVYDIMLTKGEIQGHISKVNLLIALEAVEEAVMSGQPDFLMQTLRARPLQLANIVKPEKISAYLSELHDAYDELAGSMDGILSATQIRSLLERVNRRSVVALDAKSHAVAEVNAALQGKDSLRTLHALQHPALGIQDVLYPFAADLYHFELAYIRNGSNSNVRLEGILGLCQFLGVIARINEAIMCKDEQRAWQEMNNPEVNLEDLWSEYRPNYYEALTSAFIKKKMSKTESCSLLTHVEIQEVIDEVNVAVSRSGLNTMPHDVVTQFQAAARGYLARTKLFNMLQYYSDHEQDVIKAQAAVRGYLTRRKFRMLVIQAMRRASNGPRLKPLAYYKPYERHIVAIQRAFRARKAQKDFESLMKNKTMSLKIVRKYLHLLDMRGEDFDQELLLQSLKGDISKAIRQNEALQKDLDTLDIKIGLLVKNRVSVQDVVAHVQKSKGLQRRETFYHGVEGGRTLHGSQGELNTLAGRDTIGLKALRKESKDKLDAYQNLFYLLQTNPVYLAKLVFVMPQSRTNRFLESVILSLYNFGSNQREEYLLLKLFKTALEEEIHCKVEKLSDIISGQPMVVKMIVSYNRSGRGQAFLKQLLGPLIEKVIEDKTLSINLNPVEIYKQWVNSIETETGRSAGMPYEVTNTEALQHEEVKLRLQRSITRLKQVSTLFLATIVKAKKGLPYGLLYMAKVMYNALMRKFPQIQEKEILKVIGNLIYYRFINSAIIAPDSCDIIAVANSDSGPLNHEQRKNLGCVAKVLQFAASKKGFGEESAHLMSLNSYIVDCHERMKSFFRECCHVPEPEEEFAVDQYSEATLIARPVIYISLAEICDTHQLLVDYQYQIAPEESDRLHELLDDLGGNPSLCSLLGAASSSSDTATLSHLGQTEVCLTLTDKFSVFDGSAFDAERLFVKTKQLVLSVLPCTEWTCTTLIGALKSVTTPQQEERYWQLIERIEAADEKAENNKSMLNHTNLFQNDDGRLPLEDTKRLVLKNLQILERFGKVSNKDGCQALVNSIAADIVGQKAYRTRRRQEIFKLKGTLQSLEEKKKYLEDAAEYYNQYLKQCLAHQGDTVQEVKQPLLDCCSHLLAFSFTTPAVSKTGRKKEHKHSTMNVTNLAHFPNRWCKHTEGKKKRIRFKLHNTSSPSLSKKSHKLRSKHALKYSGAKLHSKGILLKIHGLPDNQFKNVHFEFVPSAEDGVFEVQAMFMGVRVERIELDLQELLDLQYQGVSEMTVFGNTKVNVNLLIHFINTKFYSRK